ncbi:MAG: hypothetical protein WC608_01540 [Parcubacteria group bacterium]
MNDFCGTMVIFTFAFFYIFLMSTSYPTILATATIIGVVLVIISAAFSSEVGKYEEMLNKKKLLERKLAQSDDDLLRATVVYVYEGEEIAKLDIKPSLDPLIIRAELERQLKNENCYIYTYEKGHKSFLSAYRRLTQKNA